MTVLADTGVLYAEHDTDAKRHGAAVFADAVTVFERYDDRKLSFTDATTVALTERHTASTEC